MQPHYLSESPINWADFYDKAYEASQVLGNDPDEIQINPASDFVTKNNMVNGSLENLLTGKKIKFTLEELIPVGMCYFYYKRLEIPTTPAWGGCAHEWSHYEGLMTSFDFCTKCDIKR